MINRACSPEDSGVLKGSWSSYSSSSSSCNTFRRDRLSVGAGMSSSSFLVVGILGFVIFYVFLYGIPKRRSWAGLSARTSLGQCPKCCHPLPLPALSQCDLVFGKPCRQPSTLVMDFV